MLRQALHERSLLGLVAGTILIGASLTPSLTPRPPELMGVLAGICLAMGYLAGIAVQAAYSFLGFALPQVRGGLTRLIMVACAGFAAAFFWLSIYWQNQLRTLLEDLHRQAPASLAVFVVETGAPLLAGLPAIVRALVWRAMTRINLATKQLCTEFGSTTFVAFAPAQGDVSTLTGRTTYRGWAELIAPAVARVLDEEVRTRNPDAVDEGQRQLALDALDLHGAPDAELDQTLEQIVANARDLFGATGAAVTIIDHDVQLTKAAVGMPRAPMPRSMSICDLTIRRAGLLVVEDTMTDPRLAASPWADGAHGRFYAGYPVESPDGQRVGALCVVDAAPRRFSDTDAALLRQLALRVQSALWGSAASR